LATPLALTDHRPAQPEQRSTYRDESFRRGTKRDRRLHDVLATTAHELRNPLGAVMNSLAVLRLAHGDPGLVERTHAAMERQVFRMKRVIDDLLDVSRITQDRLELLDNASKYSDRGGRIGVTVERQGPDVVVRVADNGIGIPRSMLTKVFARFVQLDGSRAWAQGGLGVGLAVAKQLVELHGGTIIARSEGPGRGSEFVVRLVALPAAGVIHPAVGRQERGAPLLGA
jgi:signal transduction histidine kinase